MGEYADMAIDDGFSAWEAEIEDFGGPDGDGDGPFIGNPFRRRRGSQPKTCNRCGQTGLFWHETPDGWRLHEVHLEEDPTLHVCPPRPAENGAGGVEPPCDTDGSERSEALGTPQNG
jgi:hypothetical protein